MKKQLIIGSLIAIAGIAHAQNTPFWTGSGAIGIGTNNPASILEVFEQTPLGTNVNSAKVIMRVGGDPVSGTASPNYMFQNLWIMRAESGIDWWRAKFHDGISLNGGTPSAGYDVPGMTTKTWWERNPFKDVQTWGNADKTYMRLDQGRLIIGDKKQIGANYYTAKLHVDGLAVAKEVVVTLQDWAWPDFVFGKNYKLMPLSEVEKFYTANHHLPMVPSAGEVSENGIPLGQTEAVLLQKIEELTLYIVELEKRMKKVEEQ